MTAIRFSFCVTHLRYLPVQKTAVLPYVMEISASVPEAVFVWVQMMTETVVGW